MASEPNQPPGNQPRKSSQGGKFSPEELSRLKSLAGSGSSANSGSSAFDPRHTYFPDRTTDRSQTLELSSSSLDTLKGHTDALDRAASRMPEIAGGDSGGEVLLKSVKNLGIALSPTEPYSDISKEEGHTREPTPVPTTPANWQTAHSTYSQGGRVEEPNAASKASMVHSTANFPSEQSRSSQKEFPGTPRGTDSIPAWLTKGEYVVNEAGTRKNLPLLEQINKEGLQGQSQGLSSGGMVGDGQAQYRAKGGGFNMQPASFGEIAGALSGDPKQIMGLIKNVVQGFQDGLKDIGQSITQTPGKVFSSERVGDVGGSAFRGVEQGFHGARGVVGQYNPMLIAAEKAAGFAATVFESVETLRKWNDQLIKSNVTFAEHSAAMTKVEVSMERFNIEMDRVRGARRAESAMFHAESVQRLERSFAKWEDAWANLKGNILGMANNHLAALVEYVNKIVGFMDNKEDITGMTEEAFDAYFGFGIEEFGRPTAPRNPKPPKRI
jgi:hypothetical protein